MSWVKLDDGFFRHRKVVQAGRDARDLALASWCFSSATLSDGFIPEAALRQLAADAQVTANPRKLAARLVEVGLWEEAAGGYQIHDYLTYNPTREAVEAARAANAARIAAWRAGKAPRNGVTDPVTNGMTNGVGNGFPHPMTPSPRGSSRTEDPAEEQTPVPKHPSSPAKSGTKALVRTYATEFDAWWSAYPRRIKKEAAYRAYQKRRDEDGRSAEALLRAAERYADWFEAEHGELEYVPYPSSWLNGHEDEEWENGRPAGAGSKRNRKREPTNRHDLARIAALTGVTTEDE